MPNERNAHTGKLLSKVPCWTGWLQEILRSDGPDALRAVLEYILRTESGEVTREQLREALARIPESTREKAMSLADTIEGWGEARERIEGEARGLRTGLRTVLSLRGFAVAEADQHRIDDCMSPETLTLWLTRAATVRALSEVFAP